jgi:hypothetical protein
MSARVSTRGLLAVLCGLLLLAGCGGLPESGPVHHDAGGGAGTTQQPAYFSPPGPGRGDSPEAIVRGFMLAMQANPPSTAIARSFLSTRARATWRPNAATLVYGASTVDRVAAGRVVVRLVDAHRLDARGAWIPTQPGHTDTLQLHLVRERGQWRIDDPPDALVVIESYFQGKFAPFDLYFFDQTGRVLVPETVYLPRGEQTATNLVRALLAGPGRGLADVVRSAFPLHTVLDLSVTVSESGVAEVPLNGDVLKLPPEQLSRAMAQLAWTLRQVPGISRVRITVDGAPVPLPDGRIDVGVDEGMQLAPGTGGSRPPLVISRGRVLTLGPGGPRPAPGPFGRPGFALRSMALDRRVDRIVAVSATGTTAYAGPLLAGSHSGQVARLVTGGTDLLRPCVDMFGDVWLVDRTAAGARVLLVQDGRARVLRVPGLSGEQATGFAISPDGTRIVAALAGGATPRLAVGYVLRSAEGAVRRVTALQPLPAPSGDTGPAVDVGWASATTVAVLTRPDRHSSQVLFLLADGSPGDGSPTAPNPVPDAASTLVVGGDARQPAMVLTSDGRLLQLSGTGQWSRRTSLPVTAAAYPG